MSFVLGIVFILMFWKLLQTEQCKIINKLLYSKAIVLNRKNSQKNIFYNTTCGMYTHIFTSLKIVFFIKFKTYILNQQIFVNHLCFFIIDEIYFLNKWDESFYLMYAQIKKSWKRISCNILLFKVFVIINKFACFQVITKAKFLSNYYLI